MSDKMKVGQVVNEAVRFGRYRWGAVIRFGWLPALASVLLLIAYCAAVLDLEHLQAVDSGEQTLNLESLMSVPVSVAFGLGFLTYLVMGLLFSGVYASIFRLVAMGEERPGFFHFRMDGPAIRVFLAYLILTVIGFAIWIGAIGIGSIITGGDPFAVVSQLGQVFREAIAVGETYEPSSELTVALAENLEPYGVGMLIAFIPMIYISIKLFPFPAASAVEDRLVLIGSFRMTFGHWWTIFLSALLMAIFLMIAILIFELASSIIQMIAEFALTQGGALTGIGALLLIAMFIVSLIFNAFVYSVQFAMHAIVYRRLTTGE